MTAPILVATSIAAILGTAQGPQGTLDVAEGVRVDSTRVRASRPMSKAASAAKTPATPSSLSTASLVPSISAVTPAAPSSAVPLPNVPLWSLPTANVPLPPGAAWASEMPGRFLADSIVVDKSERRMTLYYRGFPVRRYRVALGKNPVGDKVAIGDYRTPEGTFWIVGRNPMSKFYKSLQISYPDSAHEARAGRMGLNPGGNIMIHGLPSHQAKLGASHVLADWTEGCIAVTNAEIDELWRAVQPYAAIHIKP